MKEFVVKKTPHKPLIRDVEEYMSKVDGLEANKVGIFELEEIVNDINDNISDVDSRIDNAESRIDETDKSINTLSEKLSTISVDMMISITYSELKTLRDNSELVPGVFYRITDYQCTTTQENTRAMNNQFDIIVQALSKNALSENASADYHAIEKVPVLMDSVITNKAIGSLVNIYYIEFTDSTGSGELQEDYRKGSDIFVEYGYQENEDGETVPVLYKTNHQGVDPTRPDYNPELAGADYEDVFYYVGIEEVGDVAYDRWRKIDSQHPWDSDSQIYVYTNVIVQDGSIELDSESLLIEVEEEPRLDCTKITSVYYEYIDFIEEYSNYDLRLDEDIKFAAYEYLANNEGNVVPVIYDWVESEGILKNDKFFYIGKETIDGVVYDKWRKIDDSDSERDWDAEGKMYFYTNEIVEYASAQTSKYAFESSIINNDGTLIDGAVEAYYTELVDYNEKYDGRLNSASEAFVAYDYLRNNKGVMVPVIYQVYEDEVDTEQPYYYDSRATLDGVEYDKWRKIEPNEAFGWDSVGKYYCYTNVIVDNGGDNNVADTYFANSSLTTWELKYCLDNDTTRFAWADNNISIINLESHFSNGQPLVRQPSFDGSLNETDFEEYFYAWGTQADVDDDDGVNFVYSRNETIVDGEVVFCALDGKLKYAHISSGKGVIYWMKDEYNNECPYDFKNIQFKRYMITETDVEQLSGLIGHYFGITDGQGYTVNESDYIWCYTFSWLNENDEIEDLSIVGPHLPNDEGQYSGIYDNVINTVSAYSMFYVKNPESHSIALNNNIFLNEWVTRDGFFHGCYYNTLGNDCYFNTLGNDCYSNIFGNDCRFNTFGNSCSYNTLGNDCDSNTFGNSCYSNTLGNDCNSNAFGSTCRYNTFGNNCDSNTFGNDCNYNTFGNNCNSNAFGLRDNLINYVKYVRFADDCMYINLINSEIANSNKYVYNVVVSSGVRGTSGKHRELDVQRNAAPVVFEAAGTTHIILD